MYRNVPFDPVRDFAPISTISSYPAVVVVHPSVPAGSIKELIALARAKPGTINYASGGNGTGPQMQALLFAAMAGIKLVHVPYKGGGPATTAMVAGEVQLYFAPIPSTLPFVKAGKLRALAVTSAKRTPALPDLRPWRKQGSPVTMRAPGTVSLRPRARRPQSSRSSTRTCSRY